MPKIKRTTLTEAAVKSAKPKASPYRLWDAQVPGLAIRVLKSGTRSFEVHWTTGSKAIGKWPALTLTAARTQALAILSDAAANGTPEVAKGRTVKAHTFGAFMRDHYVPWVTVERKAGKATAAAIKSEFGSLYDLPLTAITPWLIERHKAARRKAGIMPATINRGLVRIKAALSKAVEWGVDPSLTENPLKSVKRSKGENGGRVRYLTRTESKRLRAALEKREDAARKGRASGNEWRAKRGAEPLPMLKAGTYSDHLMPMVLLAMNTGMRRGELFSLTWDQVNLTQGMVTVVASSAKSGKSRHIPLNTEAREVLRQWRKQNEGSGLVFPGAGGGRMTNINKSWAGLMDAAGLDNFRFHDLRHDFASRLVMAGVDLYTVKDLMGHADFATTQRYAHLAPEHKAAAVELLGGGK